MFKRTTLAFAALVAIASTTAGFAAELTAGMKKGTPEIKSVGPATFAPQGILLVGDTQGASIFAIATDDKPTGSANTSLKVDAINEKIASLLGIKPDEMLINDLAVNPETGNAFLTVSRGRGPDATPVIIRVDSTGKLSELSLKDVQFSQAPLPNATTSQRGRADVTTDLQFINGQVIVAGLSNEEFASNLRVIPFPFADVNNGASVEIWHANHGRFETASPVRTFAVFDVGGQTNLLAAYTCTPLVKFPLSDLKPGNKVKGTTVAELGNMNRPIDMVPYAKGGKDYLLIANNSRGVMKVDLNDLADSQGISTRVSGTAGLPYETISDLKGVDHLDRLDKDHALLLVRGEGGAINLQAIALP